MLGLRVRNYLSSNQRQILNKLKAIVLRFLVVITKPLSSIFVLLKDTSVSESIFLLALGSFATASFACTAWFSNSPVNLKFIPAGRTLTVLRILQGLTSTATNLLLSQVLDRIGWLLVNRKDGRGIRVLSLLGISSATGIYGACLIIFSRASITKDRVGAAVRLLLMAMIWISGILLFLKTEVVSVNKPLNWSNVTSGVGPFDVSAATSTLKRLDVPFLSLADAYYFISNTKYISEAADISCLGDCDTYLCPGVLQLTKPDIKPDVNDTETVATIYNASSKGIQFQQGLRGRDKPLLPSVDACHVFGAPETFGVLFCLRKSLEYSKKLIAGVYSCSHGVRNGSCYGDGYNLTTTFAIYNGKATASSSTTNNSIISSGSLQDPVAESISVEALFDVTSWLLDFVHAGIPAQSSLDSVFWTDTDGDHPIDFDDWAINAYPVLKSMLAYSVWVFSENAPGSKFNATPPPIFQTYASLDTPITTIRINLATWITYLVFQTFLLLLFWLFLVWSWICTSAVGVLSSYPLINFAGKMTRQDNPAGVFQLFEYEKTRLGIAGDCEILDVLRDLRVVRQQNPALQSYVLT